MCVCVCANNGMVEKLAYSVQIFKSNKTKTTLKLSQQSADDRVTTTSTTSRMNYQPLPFYYYRQNQHHQQQHHHHHHSTTKLPNRASYLINLKHKNNY